MGIVGLGDFVENSDSFEHFDICGKKLIVDGCGLVYLLYYKNEIKYEFGGDYAKYAEEVRKFFHALKEFNITPIVIFDGSYENNEFEQEKQKKRHLKLLKDIRNYIGEKTGYPFTPINHYEVFKDVLSEMEIKHVQCDYGGDEVIAALANRYKCPVLSDDSDFYIYDLSHGFIKFSHLSDILKVGPTTTKCKIYKLDKFLNRHSIKERKLLFLFAALVGNDYSTFKFFATFHKDKKIAFEVRFTGVLNWLQKFNTLKNAKKEVLKHFSGDKRSIIEYIIAKYELKTSDGERISNILEGISSNDTNAIIKNSKMSNRLPEKLVVAFHKGCISATLLNVMNTRHSYLRPQIEALTNTSSYSCSRYIRKITYSMLIQDPRLTEAEICQQEITEHDRLPEKVGVKCCSTLNTCALIPKLSEAFNKPKADLRAFINAVLDSDENFLDNIPNQLQLLFSCIIYWILNSDPKPSKEFLFALLICIIHCQIKRKNLQEKANGKKIKTSKNESPPVTVIEILDEYAEELNPRWLKVTMDERVRILHSYSQLQTCIWSAVNLNSLLDRPFDSSKLSEHLNGTMLFNMTNELELQSNPESFIINLFGVDNLAVDAFILYKTEIYKKIPSNYLNRS